MSSIVTNKDRVGKFTSSEIHKLIKGGRGKDAVWSVAGLTYIRHKRQERKRKRSLSLDAYSRAIAWGHFMELRVFDLIGIEYQVTSKETAVHPDHDFWAGSCDLIVTGKKISEIKCYQPEKFCDYADCLIDKDIDRMRDDFSQEYWQIVSNAAINQVPKGEAILYQPYDSEAQEIKEMVYKYMEPDAWKYRYICDAIDSLPFQPNDSGYPNLVSFEFEVPKEDIEFLTNRIIEAEQKLKS